MTRLAFASALLCVLAAPAFADTAAPVGLAYGNFLASVLTLSAGTIASIVWFLVQKYVPAFYRVFLSESVVTNAVNAGLAEVEGAVAGQVLPVATVNAVIRAAIEWANANEPKAVDLIKEKLEPLIIAKLSGAGVIPAEASNATLGANK